MLFFQGDPNIKKDAWELIKANDAYFQMSGARNLQMLFKCSKEIKSDEFGKIMPMFKKNFWQQGAAVILTTETNAYNALVIVHKRPIAKN